jgi:hypothetical protein
MPRTTKRTRSTPQVLVRTYSAGVHVGTPGKLKGRELTLTNARRIWRWSGANTLHEVATSGIDTTKSRVSVPVRSITLTEVIEVIPMTASATMSLAGCGWAR